MNSKSLFNTLCVVMSVLFIFLAVRFSFLNIHFINLDRKLIGDGIPISAVITDMKKSYYTDHHGHRHYTYDAFVSYTIDDKNYTKQLSAYNITMHLNDEMTLYYFPDKGPSSADYVSIKSDVIFIVIFGGTFGLIGIGFGIAYIKHILKKRLLSTGIPIMADVTYCGYGSIKIDNRNTYVVKCEWVDESGTCHKYKSQALMKDPTDKLQNNQVEVFVNPKNYNKYCVNL